MFHMHDLHARGAALAILVGVLALTQSGLSVSAAPTSATASTLSAASLTSSGMSLKAQVRPGPYFANEAVLVQFTLRNTSRNTLTFQQPNACRFSAQVSVQGRSLAGAVLPPARLCEGAPSTLTLLPGNQITGETYAVLPSLTGPAGKTYTVQLHASALLLAAGAAKSTITAAGAGVSVPFVTAKSSTSAPRQRLTISVARDALGFTVRVGDGTNRPVDGATGWYIVHAPDGDLAWGVAAPGRTYCGTGCLTGSLPGSYQLTVLMVRDGYSIAAATVSYSQK